MNILILRPLSPHRQFLYSFLIICTILLILVCYYLCLILSSFEVFQTFFLRVGFSLGGRSPILCILKVGLLRGSGLGLCFRLQGLPHCRGNTLCAIYGSVGRFNELGTERQPATSFLCGAVECQYGTRLFGAGGPHSPYYGCAVPSRGTGISHYQFRPTGTLSQNEIEI